MDESGDSSSSEFCWAIDNCPSQAAILRIVPLRTISFAISVMDGSVPICVYFYLQVLHLKSVFRFTCCSYWSLQSTNSLSLNSANKRHPSIQFSPVIKSLMEMKIWTVNLNGKRNNATQIWFRGITTLDDLLEIKVFSSFMHGDGY